LSEGVNGLKKRYNEEVSLFSDEMSRYSKDWKIISRQKKEKAGWQCAKCGMQCLKPTDDKAHLSKSERMKRRLVVHHANYRPEDNRPENLIPLCTACHLSYHAGKRGNIPIGQLRLF
jgi:hypothetical protein